MKKLHLVITLLIVSPCIMHKPIDGLAADAGMVFQNFDDSTPPVNRENVGYPTYYASATEGGPFTTSMDTGTKMGGGASLRMHMTSGSVFYTQWNPYDGVSRDFARSYSADPTGWQFDTYNRFRFWFWPDSQSESEAYDGTQNFYLGTYVKRVTNANRSSDEDGGGHYYHPFNVLRNQWSLCTFNSHPGHQRGVAGGIDTGNRPYPTTPPYGSGDPASTYNYFDTLTRFYIEENGAGSGSFPRDYRIDQMAFYQEPYPENDDQVYSICVSYTAATNRIFLTWNRPKDENATRHEVRYAFSNIHSIGWNGAVPAPNGIVTPPGWQGYNGMVYETTAIPVSGQTQVYLAIKPSNSSTFSQVALPVTNVSVTAPPSPPTNVRVQP